MQNIPLQLIAKLGEVQAEVWKSASATLENLDLTDSLTVANQVGDLRQEFSKQWVTLSFTLPEPIGGRHWLVFEPSSALALLNAANRDSEPESELSEDLADDFQEAIALIVDALAAGIESATGKSAPSQDLATTVGPLELPTELPPNQELLRNNVGIVGQAVSGSLVWLHDSGAAYAMIGDAPGAFEPTPEISVAKSDEYSDENLDMLLDIPLEVSVELGRLKMLVRDVLDLGSGSIVEIDKAAGEPVDVRLNGNLVARGEVVVIQDNFGVRITDILKPHDRIDSLAEDAA